MSTKKIKETEDDLFDLEEESSSEDDSEESSSEEDEVLAIEKIGSENIKNNILIGGFVTALIAAGFLFIKKFKKGPEINKSGDSNYDPVNFEF